MGGNWQITKTGRNGVKKSINICCYCLIKNLNMVILPSHSCLLIAWQLSLKSQWLSVLPRNLASAVINPVPASVLILNYLVRPLVLHVANFLSAHPPGQGAGLLQCLCG